MDSIQYTLDQFSVIPNVYCYMDISCSNWLGWQMNFNPGASLFTVCLEGTREGFGSVAGFVSNVKEYVPLKEPYLPDPSAMVGEEVIRSATFYEWNMYLAELAYAKDMHAALIKNGASASSGLLIDTSRNGWGGPNRPREVSASNDLNTFVNESRIDRCLHRANWCNQPGGIGERPRANPVPGVHAYIWAWPPGYSDGASDESGLDPEDPAFPFEPWCNPEETCPYDSQFGTGAFPAPHWGTWNQDYFQLLIENAWPPLQ